MKDKINFLWYRRATILELLAQKLNCPVNPPYELWSLARKQKDKDDEVCLLLKGLQEVVRKLYEVWRNSYTPVFKKLGKHAGQSAVPVLELELYRALLKCQVGQEETFPAYFRYSVLRVYSEIANRRVTPFTISSKEKLLVRKVKYLFKTLKNDGENEERIVYKVAEILQISPEQVRNILRYFPSKQKLVRGINGKVISEDGKVLPELVADSFTPEMACMIREVVSVREKEVKEGDGGKVCKKQSVSFPFWWQRILREV